MLLHGVPATSSVWRHLAEPLSRHGRVIAPDLLGLSGAADPQARLDPDAFLRWLDGGVLAGVDEPVTLIAHDLGGIVGLNWAVRRPERVARLVLMNTSLYPEATPWGFVARFPALNALVFGLTMTRPLFGWQMRALFGVTDPGLIREYEAVYTRPEHRRTVVRAVRSWSAADLADIAGGLRRLRCPVLLLWGMGDRYIFPWDPHGERFLRDLPHARVAHVAGAGHFLQLERPAEVLRHVEAFLQDTRG